MNLTRVDTYAQIDPWVVTAKVMASLLQDYVYLRREPNVFCTENADSMESSKRLFEVILKGAEVGGHVAQFYRMTFVTAFTALQTLPDLRVNKANQVPKVLKRLADLNTWWVTNPTLSALDKVELSELARFYRAFADLASSRERM